MNTVLACYLSQTSTPMQHERNTMIFAVICSKGEIGLGISSANGRDSTRDVTDGTIAMACKFKQRRRITFTYFSIKYKINDFK